MRILQVVFKNTSTLDYSLPVLWNVSQKSPKVEIFILYCVSDKRKILRKSEFYSHELNKMNAVELDFLCFLPKYLRIFENTLRVFFRQSESDQKGFSEFKGIDNREIIKKTSVFCFVIFKKFLQLFENAVLNSYLNIDEVTNVIKPDLILLDNRGAVDFPKSNKLFYFIFKNKLPKIILPHAPHYIDPYFGFSHVNPYGDEVYPECDIWLPFLPSKPWVKRPDLKKQFFQAGYPGFDERWLNYCKSIKRNVDTSSLTCLYIGRKFLNKNVKRPDGLDFVTLNYNEVLLELKNIKESFSGLDKNVILVVKPHPSSNYNLVEKVLLESGIKKWRISNEPFYECLGYVDFVVSPYSTALLITAMAGIPTILLKSKLQDTINKHWQEVENMYSGLQYYIKSAQLKSTLNLLNENNFKISDNDIKHLRNYFKDNELNGCTERLYQLTE